MDIQTDRRAEGGDTVDKRALVIKLGYPPFADAIETGMNRNNFLAERRKCIERDRRFERT